MITWVLWPIVLQAKFIFEELRIKSFVPNAPFLYSPKTSLSLTVFWFFQGVEKGCIGNEWVNKYEWNTDIDDDIKMQWSEFLNDVLTLKAASLRRHVLCFTQRDIEFHGFCDGSGQVCCPVVFVCHVFTLGVVNLCGWSIFRSHV